MYFSGGYLLQSRNHAQRGGLSAARGSYQHEKLLIFDFQIQVVDGNDVFKDFGQVF